MLESQVYYLMKIHPLTIAVIELNWELKVRPSLSPMPSIPVLDLQLLRVFHQIIPCNYLSVSVLLLDSIQATMDDVLIQLRPLEYFRHNSQAVQAKHDAAGLIPIYDTAGVSLH